MGPTYSSPGQHSITLRDRRLNAYNQAAGPLRHLVAAKLAADPIVEGGHRVVFLSSDDEDSIVPVADLAKQLGFAPVKLGKLSEGGALVHARGRIWGPLVFQDLFKIDQ